MAKKKTEPVASTYYADMPLNDKRNPVLWTRRMDLLPQPPMELLWKEGDEFHYKKGELLWLPPAHFEVICRLIEFRTGGNITLDQAWLNELTEEELNDEHLNLWRPCDGCIPQSEIGDEVLSSIIEKFRKPLDVACNMAQILHKKTAAKAKGALFQPVPMVEPSYEDSTYYAIVDWDRHIKYLFGYDKAWVFKWHSMTAFANWVLACSLRTVQVFQALKDNELKLRNIQTDARYRNGSDTHDFHGKILIDGQ